MRCPKCGAPVEEGRTFCGTCGALVGGDTARSQNRRRVEADMRSDARADASGGAHRERQSYGRATDAWGREVKSSDRQQDAYLRPAYQLEEPKKSKAGPIIAIIVIIAIVLVALFVFPGFLKGCGSDVSGQGAAPAAGSAAIDTGTSTSAAGDFDAEKAEKIARDAALDADKQVFKGTVRTTTLGKLAAELGIDLDESLASSADEEIVLLDIEGSPLIEARAADDVGLLTKQPGLHSLRLDDSLSSYDGEKITVAVHAADMRFSDDAHSALYPVAAENVTVIAPLTQKDAENAIKNAGALAKSTSDNIAVIEEAKAQQQAEEEAQRQAEAEAEAQWQAEQEAQQYTSYYLIPDSNWRYLTRDELEAYSTYDLYLARNEIYARYGRLFANQDLQNYFWSQGWYNGTIAPGDFDTMWMSQVERDNAQLMLQIEQERNSPYL